MTEGKGVGRARRYLTVTHAFRPITSRKTTSTQGSSPGAQSAGPAAATKKDTTHPRA